MASPTVAIPGRRVSYGETFYTDWVPRGGDCFTVIAECLIAPAGGSIEVVPQTRGEDGDTVTGVTVTIGGIDMSSVGLATGICLASTSTSAGNGAQEQVRLKINYKGGSAGNYGVIRAFPVAFFDSAKPY